VYRELRGHVSGVRRMAGDTTCDITDASPARRARFHAGTTFLIALAALLISGGSGAAEPAPVTPSEPPDAVRLHNLTDKANDLNYSQGKPAQSLPYYEKALQIDPHNFGALSGRAYALISLGRCAEAISTFDRALAQCPEGDDKTKAQLYRARGDAHARLKQWQEAVEDYSASLKQKLDKSTFYDRGAAYDQLGDYEKALHDLDTVLMVFKPTALDYFAYLERGRIHKRLGHFDQAIADFGQAITLDPGNAEAYRSRGITRKDMNDRQGALADLQKALELAERHKDTRMSGELREDLRALAKKANIKRSD